jgi:CBS domain-containing protein
MAAPFDRPTRAAVRTRIVFDGGTEARSVRMVHCPRRGTSVPYGMCGACSEALALPVHPGDAGAEVECAVQSAPSRGADLAERAARMCVGELLERRLGVVTAETEWDTLEELLIDEGLGTLPVIDGRGKPIGVVTKADLLRHARDDGDRTERAPGGLDRGFHVDRTPRATAGEVMSPIVHAISERAPLSFALAALAMADVERIPVVADSGEVVGMLAARDAVRWIAQELGYVVPKPGG